MKSKTLLYLLIILAIASFIRLWQLESIPPGLYPDIALNGTEGIQAWENKDFKVFYNTNNGREGLFINLVALSLGFLGISLWSLRIASSVIGILTILGMFLISKEIFKPLVDKKHLETISLLSAFLLATSFWHTNFSRMGFRATMLPLFLIFSFYFLLKGLRTKKIINFILGGIFYGLGFHTYISFRLSVFLLGLVTIGWLIIYLKEKELLKFFLFNSIFFIFVFIVALPIGIYFLENPQDFTSRATPISVFAKENPLKYFGISFFAHLSMFNIYGDPNWRHNYAESPMLPLFLGIFFLIGFIFSIKNSFSAIGKKNRNLIAIYLFIFGWFFSMLLPSMLTYEGIPHALRSIGVIPIIYIFVSLGIYKTYQILKNKFGYEKLIVTILILLVIVSGIYEFNKYFFDWAKRPETKDAFTERFVKIGYYLNNLSPETKKYVVANDGDLPINTVVFIQKTANKGKDTIYVFPDELDKIKIDKGKNIIIIMAYDWNLFEKIKNRFPGGEIKNENDVHLYELTIN